MQLIDSSKLVDSIRSHITNVRVHGQHISMKDLFFLARLPILEVRIQDERSPLLNRFIS